MNEIGLFHFLDFIHLTAHFFRYLKSIHFLSDLLDSYYYYYQFKWDLYLLFDSFFNLARKYLHSAKLRICYYYTCRLSYSFLNWLFQLVWTDKVTYSFSYELTRILESYCKITTWIIKSYRSGSSACNRTR